MFTYYNLCQHCGTAIASKAAHECSEEVMAKHQVKLFFSEFEQWLETPAGRFAVYEAEHPHGSV